MGTTRQSEGVARSTKASPDHPKALAIGPEEALRNYHALVHHLAHRVRQRFGEVLSHDDLVAFGQAGLLEACQRFDPSRGVSFSTFAWYRIHGAMLDGCRKSTWGTRRPSRRVRAQTQAMLDALLEERVEAQAQSPPSASLAESVERVGELVGDAIVVWLASGTGLEEPPDDDPSPEERVEHQEQLERLWLAIDGDLTTVERDVVRGLYHEERTMADVGKGLNMSRSWVCRIHARAVRKLRDALTTGPGPP